MDIQKIEGKWGKWFGEYQAFRPDKCPIEKAKDPACQVRQKMSAKEERIFNECPFRAEYGGVWVCAVELGEREIEGGK